MCFFTNFLLSVKTLDTCFQMDLFESRSLDLIVFFVYISTL